MNWTLNKAGTEWGVTRETLKRGLRLAGIRTKKTYGTREIDRALHGDLRAERTREVSARADLLEFERKEKWGDLVPMSDVQTILRDCLLPCRQRLLALPSEAASRCNPTDPEHARQALQDWVDSALTMIREKLPIP